MPADTIIKIDPLGQILYKGVKNIWIDGTNTTIAFTNTLDNNYLDYAVLNLNLSLSSSFTLVLDAVNSPLQPIAGSLANITIYNSTIIYYQNNLIKIGN